MRRQAGFSRIEVMCASLILGVGLVGFTQAISTALGSSKDSELQTTGMLLASGKVEELRADGWLEDGTTDGDCGDELPNYQWKQTIAGTDIKGLHKIDLVIESSSSGKQICELHTMLFEPYLASETNLNNGGKLNDRSKSKGEGRLRQ